MSALLVLFSASMVGETSSIFMILIWHASLVFDANYEYGFLSSGRIRDAGVDASFRMLFQHRSQGIEEVDWWTRWKHDWPACGSSVCASTHRSALYVQSRQ